MGLQQFERRLERIVEGVFARAFRSGLQPVEIGRRLTREMDLRRTVAPRGRLTPNHFLVALSPQDRQRFAPIEAELVAELIAVARDHARVESYTFIGPVTIEIETDHELSSGMLLLVGDMQAAEVRSAEAPPGVNSGMARGRAPILVLDDGQRVTLAGRPVVIGRLPECDVVLADANVSRRHAELRPDHETSGAYLVVDLGSTNGTRVNGASVKSARLANGDEIVIGSTKMRYEGIT